MEKTGLRMIFILMALSIPAFIVSYGIFLILLVTAVFIAFFYRDTEREIGEGIVSPADGRIVEISDGRIEIFMNFFDCHVNRSPCDGVVKTIKYFRGRFFPAFHRMSQRNERNVIWIGSEDGTFVVEQIAGIFARRIICYLKEGERVKKGQRIGMIVFGSRVTLEIPDGYTFTVRKGEKVKAGQTVAVKHEKAY